jgi:hypothetical protein
VQARAKTHDPEHAIANPHEPALHDGTTTRAVHLRFLRRCGPALTMSAIERATVSTDARDLRTALTELTAGRRSSSIRRK